MAKRLYSSKINKIRTFALVLIFAGIGIMYIGLWARKIEWLMFTLFIIGVLFVLLSTAIYFWIGLLSARTVQIICPNCGKPTKMLGRVDICMHCDQTLTLDQDLDGKEFDEKYNTRRYKRSVAEAKKNTEEK